MNKPPGQWSCQTVPSWRRPAGCMSLWLQIQPLPGALPVTCPRQKTWFHSTQTGQEIPVNECYWSILYSIWTIATYQNCIHKEITKEMITGNAFAIHLSLCPPPKLCQDQHIQNCKSTCYFVHIWNLLSHWVQNTVWWLLSIGCWEEQDNEHRM